MLCFVVANFAVLCVFGWKRLYFWRNWTWFENQRLTMLLFLTEGENSTDEAGKIDKNWAFHRKIWSAGWGNDACVIVQLFCSNRPTTPE